MTRAPTKRQQRNRIQKGRRVPRSPIKTLKPKKAGVELPVVLEA